MICIADALQTLCLAISKGRAKLKPSEKNIKVFMDKTINTSINIIGSIPDYQFIYDVLHQLAKNSSKDEIYESVIRKNIYNIRTEESRIRFLNGVKSAFWHFKNNDHETLIRSLFKSSRFEKTKRFSLFWMFAINNTLFENITINAFIKAYLSGRVQIRNDEIVGYLNHFREANDIVRKWSDSTIDRVSSKYLTFLKKIDFVKGRQKKEFYYIQVDDTSVIFFIYLLKAITPNQHDIIKNKYIDLIFIDKHNLPNVLKKAKYTEYFNMKITGQNIVIDPKYSFEELINVISSRT